MTYRTFDASIIVPAAKTNYIIHPTPTIILSYYTASNSAINRVTTHTRRGIASVEVAPNANQNAGFLASVALTTGQEYSFSCDTLDVLGQTFGLYIYNGATLKSSTTWIGTGYWKRKYLTWTTDASATFDFYVLRTAVNSTTKFYSDGWQVEDGAVSTYLDGSMYGYVLNDYSYGWNGTPYASTSWRSAKTRSGGYFLHLSTYARVLSILGLGMASISNIAIPSSLGGSSYQTTVLNERPFVVNIGMSSDVINGDRAVIDRKRAALMNALNPFLLDREQPLQIQIDQLDETGSPIAETVQVLAHYEGGLEGDGNGDAYIEKAGLKFRMFAPLIRQDGNTSVALGYQTAVANANYILMRTGEGIWQAMAGGTNATVYSFALSSDGKLYVGGNFTNLGDANGDYISSWNGSAWASLSTGASDYVSALTFGPDGTLYAGGNFANLGGADGDYLAKWTGAAWASVAAGLNGYVDALAVGSDGALYVGGDFTNCGDANGDRIVKYAAGWVSLGTGAASGQVIDLAIGPDGSLYAGGSFSGMGGVADTAYIAKWTGSAWVSIGVFNDFVNSLAFGPDGSLYAGGVFTTINGVTVNRIARYNGTKWEGLSTGASAAINAIKFSPSGVLHVGGSFSSIGGVSTPSFLASWTGSAWIPLDVNFFSSVVTAIEFDKAGSLYIGFSNSGTAYSATVVSPPVGSAPAYPKIIFTGPGTLYQLKNYTTGKAIYFNLTLLAGETATLNLDPKRLSFVSSFRGSIWSTILPGSSLDWPLQPGANSVSTFMYGSTSAATSISMILADQHLALETAVR
jgi:hypothetical protein